MSTENMVERVVQTQKKTEEPPMFAVILHNDDYTTMEFVVEVLVIVFQRTLEEAVAIMFNVHQSGRGVAGVYPKEISTVKAHLVLQRAQQQHFPLQCTIERLDS